jgi:CBS domain-containing protein/mannitol/fructose-specific phosphotransferase system IIA component (Ntr-type)
MNLANFFDPDLIDIDLKVEFKFEGVKRLAELFCRKFPDKDQQIILRAVLEREDLGSTSFGRGFAFPHARTNVVNDLHIAFGLVRKGVLDKSPDGVPIKAICLMLTPRNVSKLYLQTLSGLANLARRPGMLDQLTSAHSSREFIEIIKASGIQVERTLTVADIMVPEVVTVSPDDSLKTVANLMFKYSFDGIPVIDPEGRLLGDVSGKELLKSALPNYEKLIVNRPELEPFENLLRQEDNLRVKDVMRREVVTIAETSMVVEAAAMMLSKNIDRIMVTRGDRLVGIISASDIISKIIRG